MKFKSKSLISIILSIMMVMSMIIVAIPANAAVIDSVPVGDGATSYYLWYGIGKDNPGDIKTKVQLTTNDSVTYEGTAKFDAGTSTWNKIYLNQSDSNAYTSPVWTDAKFTCTISDDIADKVDSATTGTFNYSGKDLGMFTLNLKGGVGAVSIKFSYNKDEKIMTISAGGSSTHEYTVLKGTETNGTFTVFPTSAAAGTEVTVTTKPDSGYEVDKVTYTYGTTTDNATGSGNSYKFNMPASNVTVNVTFKESATPTAQYYIGGRFKVKDSGGTEHLTYDPTGNNNVWNVSCTDINFKFIEDSSNSGWYYLNTNLTVSELSAQLSGKNDKGEAMLADPYFLIHTGKGDGGKWYGAINDNAMHSLQNTNALPASANLENRTGTNEEKYLIKFSGTQSTIAGNVTLHFNPTELKLYYTTDSTSTPGDFKIVDKTAANGKLTFSASDKAAGTASADDEVTVTATPDKYFECTEISVSYKDNNKVAHKINSTKNPDNTFKFTVPADLAKTDVKDQEITVKGTFTLTSSGKLDYVKDQDDGLYIDVAPTQNDTTATLIKWNNYYDKDHNTNKNPYTFYVPKNVDLSQAQIYNGFNKEVKINGVSISAHSMGTVRLIAGQTYDSNNDNSYKVKVMQGSTNAMFLTTSTALPTQYNPDVKGTPTEEDKTAKEYKEKVNYKGGSCKTMTNSGSSASFSSAMGLSSIKGRGNSSWKASAMNFGKYAFNMKLSSATNLFNMDTTEPTGSKSWCLLANNADESMLRNALTYQLASEIGLAYSPEFSFVDIYDNGEYMGSYLVTEKVDVGKSKLVKGESFDDINEKAAGTVVEEAVTNEKYSYGDKTHEMSYAKVKADGNTSSIASKTGGKYLLEFEITERYKDEASWFTSPRGQHVVVKSPEFATKEQVTYIAQKFAAMEEIVYNSSATKAQLSTVMDVESFAKMYLIQEFSSNLDAASTSYYLTFDCSKNDAEGNGAVFVANPVWDYDWAYGQYYNTTKKGKAGDTEYTLNTEKAGTVNDGQNYWVAKYKYFDDSKGDNGKQYSIQSQLASQNPDFKAEIRKQWEGTNGFYTTIQKYYGADGQIMTWYNQIKDSVDMNETRWGFIKNNPIKTWGSTDTGDTHLDAVNYLKTNWTEARATWLNAQFTDGSEYAPFTPATPASTVTDLDGIAKTSFEVGESFLINVTTVEDGVTYSVYLGETKVGDNVENGKIKVVATADMVGEKTFTVKATYGEKVVTSNVKVTVNASSYVKKITVYFKTATAPAYAPSVSFDGDNVTAMTTKTQELGKDYSGSLTFAWYSVEIQNVDTTKTHTLTFTSKRTKLNATWNGTLTKDSYFTADNLMNGTVAVNLTDKGVAELNFFYSATNMVYDSTDAKNKTLGFTFVGNARVKMGTVVNVSNGTVTPVSAPTVKSATYIQMVNASMITVSSLQSELYDVNFDGKVDIKDATYIQYALAS